MLNDGVPVDDVSDIPAICEVGIDIFENEEPTAENAWTVDVIPCSPLR